MAFQFNNPVPRGSLPINFETSPLQSPRESGSVFKDWKRIQLNRQRDQSLTQAIGSLYRQTSRDIRPPQASSRLHPFKIYQFIPQFRVFTPADAPKRFKVRGGAIYQPFTSYAALPGTDGALSPNADTYLFQTTQVPPNDATLISDSWNEVVVPNDGIQYSFWASMCLPTATEVSPQGVCFGTNPSTALSLQSGNIVNDPWPNFPINDPYHWLIGNVQLSGNTYVTDQFVRDNIFTERTDSVRGVGVNKGQANYFLGEYDSTTNYYVGDSVTVTIGGTVSYFVYSPTSSSTHKLENGPMSGIDPTSHNPDPWIWVSKSTIP